MARKRGKEQPRLLEAPLLGPGETGRRDVRRGYGLEDPGLKGYVASLKPSNCPGCGRAQKTPRGEPMMCPACTGRKGTVGRPSVPMEAGRRRR